MTTVTAIIPARARGAVAAEWIKLRSVRSTYLALAAAAVAAIALGYLVTHYVASSTHWATMSPQARATWDPVSYSQGGLAIAQLAFGTLGVLVISSEHATGLIRTTFTATPWRRAVLAAKAALHGSPGYFPPSSSLIVCLGYAAALLGAAAILITRRDA